MNIDELKANWEELHGNGLDTHDLSNIKRIVGHGTSHLVGEINKKLFKSMALTAIASIVSALTIVFFYLFYDAAQYPWIDISKLIPIQLLAFAIFLSLFLANWAEYRLVNRKFTSISVSRFISELVAGFRRYFWLITSMILLLLFIAYLLELRYFIAPTSPLGFVTIVSISIILTVISGLIVWQYYKRTFEAYFTDMQSYLDELKK